MALGLFGVILVISLLGCICLVVLRDRVVYGDGVCPPAKKNETAHEIWYLSRLCRLLNMHAQLSNILSRIFSKILN